MIKYVIITWYWSINNVLLTFLYCEIWKKKPVFSYVKCLKPHILKEYFNFVVEVYEQLLYRLKK